MSWSDPIADMLTRVRNGLASGASTVDMPHSRLKREIAVVLKREGYIRDYTVEAGRTLRLYLKYVAGEPVIRGIRRHSSPGCRVYVQTGGLPRILGGMGLAILSTSAGILTDKEARKRNVGGEFLCSVW